VALREVAGRIAARVAVLAMTSA